MTRSSFYGLGTRHSSVLGEDPLFSDHDPVTLIGIARQGTHGFTRSSTLLAKNLTTITERFCFLFAVTTSSGSDWYSVH